MNPQLQITPETNLLRAAGIALGLLCLGAIAFFGSYALAGVIYPSPTQSQTASVVAPNEPDPFASVALIAKSAYVYDMTTGQVLYQQNASAQLPLASLTKVALVLSVIQALPADTLVSTPTTYTAPPSGGTSRLPAGQTWTLGDVISFTLTASSDDGADLLAAAANDTIHQEYPESPAQGATIWRMNELVQQLGLTNTYYLNDNGLDISTTQSGAYGSAHDMAMLFAYAASTSPSTFSATTQPSVTVHSTTGVAATGVNTDTALEAIPGIVMGKTGYTDLAGGNLAVVFNAAGHEVVAVVLGSTQDGRFSDMEQIVPAAQTAAEEGR
jgi:D-alanyl-D-alanine carboxypeptidase (penicillin-binding protein 5/6)